MAKAASWTGIDAEERKPGEQTGLDTPVVLALNDECLVWRVSIPGVQNFSALSVPPVEYVRKAETQRN